MEFLWIFFGSFAVSAVAVFLMREFGKRRKLFDPVSDLLKIHANPTTYLGGIGMMIAFAFGILTFVLPRLADWQLDAVAVFIFLAFAFLFMLYGLIDDIWWKEASKSRPWVKLGMQVVLIAGFAWFFNVPAWSVPLVFVVLNSVNTTDGMDGMAATMVLWSLVGIFSVVALTPSATPFLVPVLILAGSVFGFLIFNFPPASVFMGDNGSYFLGFMMAYFTLLLIGGGNWNEIAGAMLIVGMPAMDLLYVSVARMARRKSLIRGGRDHLYDLLRARLLGSARMTLLIYGLIQAIVVATGVKLYLL